MAQRQQKQQKNGRLSSSPVTVPPVHAGVVEEALGRKWSAGALISTSSRDRQRHPLRTSTRRVDGNFSSRAKFGQMSRRRIDSATFPLGTFHNEKKEKTKPFLVTPKENLAKLACRRKATMPTPGTFQVVFIQKLKAASKIPSLLVSSHLFNVIRPKV